LLDQHCLKLAQVPLSVSPLKNFLFSSTQSG
jgi:hypothetical protein